MSKLDFDKRVLEARYYFIGPVLDASISIEEENGEVRSHYEAPHRFLDLGENGIRPQNHEMAIMEPWPNDYLWMGNLKFAQSALRNFLQKRIESPNKFVRVGEIGFLFGLMDGRMRVWFDRSKYFGVNLQNPSHLATVAKMSLSFAFDGIPRDAVKRFENKDCGKYFLHLSKKERYFCSPRCTSQAMARRRREKAPDRYRAKQRKIMRERYREQKAQELGIPVDKVKIRGVARKKEG
jgi:hypothetical protein